MGALGQHRKLRASREASAAHGAPTPPASSVNAVQAPPPPTAASMGAPDWPVWPHPPAVIGREWAGARSWLVKRQGESRRGFCGGVLGHGCLAGDTCAARKSGGEWNEGRGCFRPPGTRSSLHAQTWGCAVVARRGAGASVTCSGKPPGP